MRTVRTAPPLLCVALAGLSGCVFHGPRATARLAPERHPVAGKQLSLTVAGRRPPRARVVHRARLNHGAPRAHVPSGPAAPWLPAAAGLAVSAGGVLLDGPPSHRCGVCGGLHPDAVHPPETPASVSSEVPSAVGSCSG